MAKKHSYKGNTQEELHRIVADKKEELRSLRFVASGSKNRNVKLARSLRHEVARAMTELNAKAK